MVKINKLLKSINIIYLSAEGTSVDRVSDFFNFLLKLS